MSVLETRNLTKRFGDVTAVDGVSFAVEEGEVFGFLGPNGAGKSTTINVLLGYMSPTSGSASILGHDVETESRALRARTGVLPENVGVYDRLTGREHVASAIRIKDADDDPERLLARVGLDPDAWDRRAGGYSTGMAQRMALATALAGDPDLLVLDEPQSGLDPNGMQEIRDVVLEEAADGTTVFFSSHILPEVEAVSDRVGVMRAGEMAAVDDIDALRERWTDDTVVRATVADPPVRPEALADLDGVSDVAVEGDRVTLSCRTPRAKGRAVAALERTVGVADFEVEEGSLEDTFTALTGGADAGETTATTRADDPEVSA
ncbi:ABC transporter ATP-binding protein [Halorussus gelatinilyticus]|uniref:ABC transporter ATP-binding protein n=1 Tax=Halorussus gelatinilyticus TaxID=2937524 RepID=A0A8U0INW9_9EURY|nr:ABC transporter ATP-binding protein [Halorussus gelatinilyticus]UPW02246.1 ABC transporter ATP-binding protein [Halorussus gelatinilyticus]